MPSDEARLYAKQEAARFVAWLTRQQWQSSRAARVTVDDHVLQFARSHGQPFTVPAVENATGYGKRALRQALRKLVAAGRLTVTRLPTTSPGRAPNVYTLAES